MCDYKRAEEQNRLLTGVEKCTSGVNSQAIAHVRIVILRHFAVLLPPVCPGHYPEFCCYIAPN